MSKWLTLEEWRDLKYKEYKPTVQTLQRWARDGKIYPAPEKHGRQYVVRTDAIYVNPTDVKTGEKIKEAQSNKPAKSAFMQKVINDTAARKV
ncbi:excisionase [Rouxiella silvae]|uniref:Excisionase n=2 Tax=Rouxiella silvae TaxID=1646373 RepID=A0ABX3TY00_9GAMM|nr:excisionase [Rouxiella silvae]